jgi:putative membrane protein
MKRFLFQIIGGILAIYLSAEFIPGIIFTGPVKTLFLIGLAIGILNFIIKPILKIFFFPLRLLTLGLFGLVINIGITWLVAYVLFPINIQLDGLFNLLELTIVIWAMSLISHSITKD